MPYAWRIIKDTEHCMKLQSECKLVATPFTVYFIFALYLIYSLEPMVVSSTDITLTNGHQME